jgi:protein required for attachment to host cells
MMQKPHIKKIKLEHGSLVFVADGQKAIFLRNAGDALYPNFRTIAVLNQENPPTHEQGTGSPGRSFKRAGTNRRSSVATTDWHDLGEERFAQKAAAELQRLANELKVKAIVVVAPPRALADLRLALPQSISQRVIAEIDKDLTNHPVGGIEKRIMEFVQ